LHHNTVFLKRCQDADCFKWKVRTFHHFYS